MIGIFSYFSNSSVFVLFDCRQMHKDAFRLAENKRECKFLPFGHFISILND